MIKTPIAVNNLEKANSFRKKQMGMATMVPSHCWRMPSTVWPRLRPTPGGGKEGREGGREAYFCE